MTFRFAPLLAASALTLAALPAAAITFGVPDGNGHPFVGTLLFERADGFYSCSGTMMSPTVMLTAGHNFAQLEIDPNAGIRPRLHYSSRIDASASDESFGPILAGS